MNLTNIKEVLEARESRATMQCGLLSDGGVLVSYTLNIPGPVKNANLYRMVFDLGLDKIRGSLQPFGAEETDGCSAAGNYAFFLIKKKAGDEKDRDLALRIKEQMTELEEESDLGRLFDIDVLYLGEEGLPEKVSRTALGKEARNCLVCGGKAFVCVRAGRHKVPEVLMQVTDRILGNEEIEKKIFGREVSGFAEQTAMEALRAIMYEVITTPKPGLVDAENNGAHTDMDITLFFDSALSVTPYFRDCVRMGEERADGPPEELLPFLRPLGIRAEEEMYRATGGVNTHKGAIFTLGLFCAAAGILHVRKETDPWEKIPRLAGRIASSMENGTRGIRTEATGGYPSLMASMGAVLREMGETGSVNEMGVRLLLELMSRVDDSNIVRRSGEEAAEGVRNRAQKVLGPVKEEKELFRLTAELDRELIRENLSPGGSADLLAAGYFLLLTEPLLNAEKSSRIKELRRMSADGMTSKNQGG